MAVTKQFTQLDPINNGTTAKDNFKLSDAIPAQHTDLTSGVNTLVHRTLAQSLCEPVAVCNSKNPQNGAYTATCKNYPDFALSYQDAQQNTQYLIGLKIRVIFTYGITYGSVSDGTYPTLNINGSGAIPMLAQGKTMATGSAAAGQSLEFTVIPYGNGIAFDADSNVRESTSDYTIYTDGSTYKTPINSITQNETRPATSGAIYSLVEWWNLRIKAYTPTSETSETIWSSRKISDYKFLCLELGSSSTDTRETLFIPTSKITAVTDYNILMFSFFSGTRVDVEISFTSDTTYKIKASTSGIFTGIYGLF